MRRGLVISALAAAVLLLVLGWWYFDLGHEPVEKVPRLQGCGMEEVRAQLGSPDWEHDFAMGDGLGEFYVGLYNVYPPDDPNTKTVKIKEWRWTYRRYNLAVFFHQVDGRWVVLNTLRWKHGIEF